MGRHGEQERLRSGSRKKCDTDLGSLAVKSFTDVGPAPQGGAVVLTRHDRGRPGAGVIPARRGGSSACNGLINDEFL